MAESSKIEPEWQSCEPVDDVVVERRTVADLIEEGFVLLVVLLASLAPATVPGDGVELMVAHRRESRSGGFHIAHDVDGGQLLRPPIVDGSPTNKPPAR
ncbi:MAG: hypothetical protein IPL07_21915 [Acidimicrobiaceae bacterium]|nr:hypothetical protein [Acidimicrobiaceae bacterium]